MTDLYADLGLQPGADDAAIRAAHRRAAKRTHPDTGGDRAEFEKISRAAMVLRDPTKRARYDETGQVDDEPDNAASIIAGMQVAAFNAAMSQGDYEVVNIIARMKTLLDADKAKVNKAIGDIQTEQKAVKSAQRRLKFKGTGINHLAAMLEQKERQLETGLAQGAIHREHIAAAIAGLKDFSWEVDQREMFSERDLMNMSSDEMLRRAMRQGGRFQGEFR